MTRPLALLSLHDKAGLVDFARALLELDFELVASGGTAKALAGASLPVLAVESLTGFPELLDGRVKTLHPAIHAGLLSRRNEADTADLERHGLRAIDLVAVSLYPFEEALGQNVSEIEQIEEIDIGGVTLLRAAAKNHANVTVVPGPEHYAEALAAHRGESPLGTTRSRLAAAAFSRTAAYDAAIAGWLGAREAALEAQHSLSEAPAPEAAALTALHPGHHLAQALRYGENPHQQAVFLERGAPAFRQLSGKELSYNNLLDLEATWSALGDFEALACVIVKHGSPCGIVQARPGFTGEGLLASVIARAIAADPTSAFGGILAVNAVVDLPECEALGDLFLEVLAAPAVTAAAADYLASRKKNCRVLVMAGPPATTPTARSVLGGLLVQTADTARPEPSAWQIVSTNTAHDTALAAFAWSAVKHVKSNAIVLAARDGELFATVGIGGGQTNRIDAVRQALERAGARAHGAVLASDAFFPFADGVEAAAPAGVSVVLEPGGAMRDAEVIAAADRLGLTLVFTGRRHFRH